MHNKLIRVFVSKEKWKKNVQEMKQGSNKEGREEGRQKGPGRELRGRKKQTREGT